MRVIAATLVACLTVLLSAAAPESVVTVAQQDLQRSYLDASSVSLSADGRYVAFTSYAQLVPADTNDHADIYVLDRADGRVTLESLDASDRPSISADGRFVVFETDRTIVCVDREHSVRRVLARGTQPSISADGRFVAFVSVEGVHRLELETGVSRAISVLDSGVRPMHPASVTPSLSGDGRYVAFASSSPGGSTPAVLLANASGTPHTPAQVQVYVRDAETGTTVPVSAGGRRPDGDSWAPAISADGRYVAFVSAATNLVSADRNQSPDVFVADLHDGSVQLVSRSSKSGTANGSSSHPAISADGRLVAFQSSASDLVCAAHCAADSEDINLLWDVFLFDSRTKMTACLSGDRAGSWMEPSIGPSLDAAGDVIAFSSRHPINPHDTKNDFDLFVVSR